MREKAELCGFRNINMLMVNGKCTDHSLPNSYLQECVESQSVNHDVHCEEKPVVDHLVVRGGRQTLR